MWTLSKDRGGQHICFELLTKHEIGAQYSLGNVVVWIERESMTTETSVSNEKVGVITLCNAELVKLYKTTVLSCDFAVLNNCTVYELWCTVFVSCTGTKNRASVKMCYNSDMNAIPGWR
jgi:hypothetical protein